MKRKMPIPTETVIKIRRVTDECGDPISRVLFQKPVDSTPESVTNIPSRAYLDGLRSVIRPELNPHWTEGPIGFILLALGVALPFVLSMIFAGGR